MIQLNPDHEDNTVGSRQSSIIIGTLLGDGFLERNGQHTRLVVDHSASQEQYVRWMAKELDLFSPTVFLKRRIDKRTDRVYNHCILRTKTSPSLEEYFSLFYENGRKRIPSQLPKIITAQMLAVWIMDDGYRRNDCNAFRINTQSYSFEEQRIIQKALATLSIDATIQKHTTQFVIYIPSRSMAQFRAVVRRFIIPSMEYKIA